MEMPKFNFNFKTDLSEQDLVKAENFGSFKQFEPGSYDLQIINAKFHKPSESDPTWGIAEVTFGGIDDRSIKSYVLFPTSHIEYRKHGIKNPLIMIGKFREFLRSIGVSPEISNLNSVMKEYFSDLSYLIGLTANVVIDYEGNHLAYDPATKEYALVDKKGNRLSDASYTDRDAAKADAAELGTELKNFTKIVRFNPRALITKSDAW